MTPNYDSLLLHNPVQATSVPLFTIKTMVTFLSPPPSKSELIRGSCAFVSTASYKAYYFSAALTGLQDSMYPEENETTVLPGHGRSESPVYTNLKELKSTQTNLPPLPSGSPLHVIGDWETHKDHSGRHYYYNHSTNERTWKPPRSRETSIGHSREERHSTGDSNETTPLLLSPTFLPFLSLSNGRVQPLSSEDTSFSTYSSRSDSQYGSPLRGWSEEMDEHGHTLYISDYTNEKWLKHVDDQGRSYYYSADGSRSEWELPKYKHSPPQLSGNVSKTQSLDRKIAEPIVLTKWRHSAYIQEPSEKPSEKCGVLNVTKITENSKKVRKNWTSSWTVLQGSVLLFAKGQGGGASWFGGGQSKPEFTVDLRGGSADWASKDKSSKKHVLEVKTRQGTELLIQSDNDGLVSDWLKALQEAINTHPVTSDDSRSDSEEEKPAVEKQDKEKDLTASKKVKTLKPTTSVETSDNKKAKKRLKHFLTRRPTLQAVKDKGYIKDQVFGSSLSSLCQQENTTVPLFVKMCIDHVENSNLSMDGLYRVNGNLAIIQKLRFAVNHDEKVNLADAKWEDIHVTTGALKMFFRELPEPLFTYPLFNDFVSAIKIPDYKQRLQSIRELVRQLPKPNHDTLQALFKHLKKVIEHGEENRMTTQSVAIVFGPTLLRPETETLNVAFNMVYQNQIVEFILLEYENIFGRSAEQPILALRLKPTQLCWFLYYFNIWIKYLMNFKHKHSFINIDSLHFSVSGFHPAAAFVPLYCVLPVPTLDPYIDVDRAAAAQNNGAAGEPAGADRITIEASVLLSRVV
uniref:Rho GTPase activating protein 12a n=1 Tax=Nothobranchius rachovii TaxID=451742 RepID=A0A1A8R7D3_9TELE